MSRSKDQKLIDRFVQGIATRAETETVETRLRLDKWFHKQLQETLVVIDGIKAMPELVPPQDLVAGAEGQLSGAGAEVGRRPWFYVSVAAASVAAITVLISIVWNLSSGPPALLTQMTAADVTGSVWLAGSETKERPKQGDQLLAGQRFVVGGDGSLTFRLRGRGTMVVGERSRIGIVDPGPETVAVTIEQGALRVVVEGENLPPLQIWLAGMKQRVEIRDGTLGVLWQSPDTAVVACEAGTVLLEQGDDPMTLEAGYQVVVGGSTIGAPQRISDDLRLRLEPVRDGKSDQTLVIAGKTDPGAEVWVNGQTTDVDAQGRFSLRIPIPKHKRVVVIARDALLRRKNAKLAFDGAHWNGPQGGPSKQQPPTGTQWQWERGEPG